LTVSKGDYHIDFRKIRRRGADALKARSAPPRKNENAISFSSRRPSAPYFSVEIKHMICLPSAVCSRPACTCRRPRHFCRHLPRPKASLATGYTSATPVVPPHPHLCRQPLRTRTSVAAACTSARLSPPTAYSHLRLRQRLRRVISGRISRQAGGRAPGAADMAGLIHTILRAAIDVALVGRQIESEPSGRESDRLLRREVLCFDRHVEHFTSYKFTRLYHISKEDFANLVTLIDPHQRRTLLRGP
jgi:hypothetical protein